MVKILHVISSMGRGGRERQLLTLYKNMRVGYDVKIVYFNEAGDNYFNEYDIDASDLLRIEKKRFIPRVCGLFSIVNTFQPDILHSWGPLESLLSLIVSLFRCVKTVNGAIRNARSYKPFSPEWFILKLTFKFSNAVTANSLAGLRAFKLTPSGKNRCIHNGFDFSRIEFAASTDDSRKYYSIKTRYAVGMLANFTASKDYETYIDTAKNILKTRKDVTFFCIGAGRYMGHYKQSVGPECCDLIKFTGELSKVESLINILDIGILATNTGISEEGCSNAVMEYMAFRKPVIATDSGGVRELIIDNKTGFLVPAKDPKMLEEKINWLLGDRGLAAAMGRDGELRIRTEFSLEKMTSSYTMLYNRLANSKLHDENTDSLQSR